MAEDGSKSSSSHSREHRERRHGEQHRSSRHSHHREHHRDSESSRTERERRHEGDRHGHEHRHGHGHRSSRRQERERSRSEDSEERRERKERKRKRREERGERGAYKRRAHDDEDGADETKRNERVVVVDDDEGGAVPVPMPPGPAIPGVGDADVGVEPPESTIPTSAALSLTSHAPPSHSTDPAPLLPDAPTVTQLKRDDWMLSEPQAEGGNTAFLPPSRVRQPHGDLRAEGVRDDQDELQKQSSRPKASARERIPLVGGEVDAPAGDRGLTDGYGEESAAGLDRRALGGGVDFFSSLGKERERKPKEEKPDPEKLKISKRELNSQLVEGKTVDEYVEQPKKEFTPGAPGHQWRMMKLRRVYETAEEEKRPVEEVALERYGNLESFNEARTERQFLDDRERARGGGNRSGDSSGRNTPTGAGGRRAFMFTDSPGSAFGGPPSRPSSRQSFRKPGESSAPSTPSGPSGPSGTSGAPAPLNAATKRMGSFRKSGYETPTGRSEAGSSKAGTPIPSVFTPTMPARTSAAGASDAVARGSPAASASASGDVNASLAVRNAVAASQARDRNTVRPLSSAELNKLQAKAMRAELMGSADAPALRIEYERESVRAQTGGDKGEAAFFEAGATNAEGRPGGEMVGVGSGSGRATEVQVLPTLDGRGRLYDVGHGTPGDEEERAQQPGNRRKKKENFETRDAKTGEVLRYNADDDQTTLADLVRQERFGAGSADQKNLDAEMASRIAGDHAFKDNIEYLDDNADRLARKKMKSDAMKRQFAINDFARTKKALDTCNYCWQDEGAQPPRACTVSSGTRAYLALPDHQELVEGHCYIVPMQHHLSSLEADDDCWEEIKNFMKCLMQMAAEDNKGVVFYETIISFKQQRHTYIEAVPMPWDTFQEVPAYFKESILSSEQEWSQHSKLIDFSKRGFRRSMVPQLPYFMVQWDYKGEKGYGHVIEGNDAGDAQGDGDEYGFDEGGKGDGDFPRWFAAEILGNLLELEPRRWRNPRRINAKQNPERLARFRKSWDRFDWTKMLDEQPKGRQEQIAAASGSGNGS